MTQPSSLQNGVADAADILEHPHMPGSLRSQVRVAKERARRNRSKRESNPDGDPQGPRAPTKWEIYRHPLPIKTVPLPTVYPHNPVSWLYFAYAWLKQASVGQNEPSVVHTGVWSSKTGSVHVRDEKSKMSLWEEGFYGKGNFSRSGPEWHKRSLDGEFVSALHTEERRLMRQTMKWERARVEREAIWRTQLDELRALPPPVGPLELLALPNTLPLPPTSHPLPAIDRNSPFGDLGTSDSGMDLLPNGSHSSSSEEETTANGHALESKAETMLNGINGALGSDHGNSALPNGESNSSGKACGVSTKPTLMKRRKSVRFSPKVESTTFQLSDPPSPGIALLNGKVMNGEGGSLGDRANGTVSPSPLANGHVLANGTTGDMPTGDVDETDRPDNVKEHLQLSREEAFFLSFALGTLSVVDEETNQPIETRELFELLRRYSYAPGPAGRADLRPDDKFLVQYAFYHKAREQGWVPRGGIKFGVEWLLYFRGPPFDHAEYGVVILPSYEHPWWAEHGQHSPQPSWHYMHAALRVLNKVFKTLLVVYIEIPPAKR